jgi:hypothetical protein
VNTGEVMNGADRAALQVERSFAHHLSRRATPTFVADGTANSHGDLTLRSMSAAHHDPCTGGEGLSCPEWCVRNARAKRIRLDLEKLMHLRVANLWHLHQAFTSIETSSEVTHDNNPSSESTNPNGIRSD